MTDLVFSGMKVIAFQRSSEIMPFMVCIIKNFIHDGNIVKLILMNNSEITVSDYDFFNVFEAENISDEEKIVSIFKSASDSLVK